MTNGTDPLLREFDLDRSFIYLNSGTLSITPRPVFEAFVRHARDYERNPTRSLVETWEKLWQVQQDLAAFFHANAENLFLHHNVTEALNEFILGVPLPAGEIAVTDLEYGAIVNVCRLRSEKEDRVLRTLTLPASEADDEDSLVELIVSRLGPDTRLLLASHVMTGTGLVLPLRKLARETRARGIVLVVDGAHGPGAVPLDFRELEDVDFYAGNLHKWMMGPKGTAFGWVPERWHRKLEATRGGWTTFEIPEGFRAFGNGNPFTLRFLRSSCHQFAPFFALGELLQFWRHHSWPKIDGRRRMLQARAAEEMARLGWSLISPAQGSLQGPLLTYELPSRLEVMGYRLMHELLTVHALQVATPVVQGKSRLRLSPHIYNTEEEIARGAEILRKFCAGL